MSPQQPFQLMQAPHQFTYAPQSQKKGGRGGTLTSLISEGGALGGAAAGAAAGSVVPVIGTAIGGILGAGLGAFGGRLAENKIRDNRWGVGDAAKEAALTTALAGPLRTLKYGATAAKALGGGSGLADALTAAAEKSSAPGIIGRTVGKAIGNAADNAFAKSIGVGKKAKNDFKAQYGEKLGSVARQYGITDESSARAAIAPLQNEFDQTFKGTQVAKNDLKDMLTNLYQPYLKGIDIKERGLGKDLQTQVKEILNKYKGSDKVNLEDVVKLRKEFDSKITKYKTDDAARGFYQTMSDGLREITRGFGDQLGLKTASGKTVRQAGQELSQLYSILKEAQKNAEGPGGTSTLGFRNLLGGNLLATAGGGPAGFAGMAMTAAANSDAGRRVAAKGLDRLATRKAQGSIPGILGATNRAAKAQLVEGALNLPQSSNSDMTYNTTAPTSPITTAMTNANISPLNQTTGNMSSTGSPLAPQNLEAAIQKILENGGTLDDASKFVSLAETVQKLQGGDQAVPGYSKPTASQYAQGVAGEQSIAQLQQILQQNPGIVSKNALPGQGLGVVGSLLSGALGTSDYRAITHNILNSIARINTGANMPAEEEAFYRKTYLPQPGDSPQTQQDKINTLESFFTPITQYPGSSGSDSTDLVSALMAAQGSL